MPVSPSQIIVLATPVFLLLMAAEFAWSRARGRVVYRTSDAISSTSLGVLSQLGPPTCRVRRRAGEHPRDQTE